jgi:polyhydroxyalkanoate synthesis regulator phasin
LKAKKEIAIAVQKESEMESLKRTVYDLKSQVSDLKFELDK